MCGQVLIMKYARAWSLVLPKKNLNKISLKKRFLLKASFWCNFRLLLLFYSWILRGDFEPCHTSQLTQSLSLSFSFRYIPSIITTLSQVPVSLSRSHTHSTDLLSSSSCLSWNGFFRVNTLFSFSSFILPQTKHYFLRHTKDLSFLTKMCTEWML